MKIFYVGTVKSIIKNLTELGAEVISSSKDCDGIIITQDIPDIILNQLIELNKPIIINGDPERDYKNINILILSEDKIDIFYNKHNIKSMKECKDKLKELGIKYLVVSLGKEKIKKCIQYNLPKVQVQKVDITEREVVRAKDVITAIVGYTFIKEKSLSTESIEKAQIGSCLLATNNADDKNIKDYYIDIKLR